MKSIAVGILFIISMLLAASIGYDQGQYNLYARQCVQEGGSMFEGQLPCVFKGQVNRDIDKRMTMLCDNPLIAYHVESRHSWRHYCE